MRVDVVVPFLPRSEMANRHWKAYLPLLELQARVARKFEHRFFVVTDFLSWVPAGAKFDVIKIDRQPNNLMQAILGAQVAYLDGPREEARGVVLLDADCLVVRDLAEAFDGRFDLLLTNRDNPDRPQAPINNGAMYCAPGSKAAVADFFARAAARCATHWGADQEAIAAVAAPVPSGDQHFLEDRHGVRIFFGPMIIYNVAPKMPGIRHKKNPFVVHFKGEKKDWMQLYADRFIFSGAKI